MSSLMEALFNDTPHEKAEWNNRTVESVSDGIISGISNLKSVCGINANTKPREIILTRHAERTPEFKAALEILATHVLELFPNLVDTKAEKN